MPWPITKRTYSEDLLSELTSGGEDEALALLDVGVDLLEEGDGESGSLTSTYWRWDNEGAPRVVARRGAAEEEDIPDWAWAMVSLPSKMGRIPFC